MGDFCKLSSSERSMPAHDIENDPPIMLTASLRIFSDSDWIGFHRV